MARARVQVDFELCERYGLCVEAAPHLFELASDVLVHPAMVEGSDVDASSDAEFMCPTQAIRVELSKDR